MTINIESSSDSPAANHSASMALGDDELFVGQISNDHDIDGLELSEAARILGASVDEVWRRIRNGKLIARTMRGKVLVYTDMTGFLAEEGLPPPPVMPASTGAGEVTPVDYRTAGVSVIYDDRSRSQSQELALLIDHLSLAKDENREILKLTQDSMNRLTQMTDAIIEMKDSLIATKEEQVKNLQHSLSNQAQELLKILKEKEDLETLTQTLLSK